MSKKINKNLDIIRVFALALVVIYHAFVIFNISLPKKVDFLNDFIKYFGEIGVTLFFIISGYCIYYSIERNINKNGKFNFREFIGKRFNRIFPEYAFSIVTMLLLTSQVVFISNDLTQLVTHLFFFHNFFPETHGAISGVLWTMGVIFQFYLIAYLLYKAVRRFPKTSLLLSLIITILLKFFVYKFIAPAGSPTAVYLVYSRQLFTSIDNFIIGMVIAHYLKKDKDINFIKNIFLSFFSLVGLIIYIYLVRNINIYSISIYGYLFHSGLAIVLGLNIYFFLNLKLKCDKQRYKPLFFLAKYEYGIYIWHLLIMENFAKNSIWFNSLGTYYKLVFTFIIITLVGIISTEIIGNFDYHKLLEKFKSNKEKWMSLLIILFLILFLPNIYKASKRVVANIEIISSNKIIKNDNLETYVDEINSILKDKRYTYLYVDNLQEEGYFNYYRIRYYLSPKSPFRYNDYIEKLQLFGSSEILEYLNSVKVDYVIVRDWDFLENQLINTNSNNHILVYKLNQDKSETISEKLIPMNGGYLK